MIAAFRAHKGNVSQTECLTNNYTPVAFGATDYNDYGYFNIETGLWKPPAAFLMMSCVIWCQANFVMPPTVPYTSCNVCAKWHKTQDGASWWDITACPGWTPAGFTNTAGAGLSATDYTDGTWSYQLIMFTTSADGSNSVVINGDPPHTWWCGTAFVGEQPKGQGE
jgi:hypothetical protein